MPEKIYEIFAIQSDKHLQLLDSLPPAWFEDISLQKAMIRANTPSYLHWEQLRFKDWIPTFLQQGAGLAGQSPFPLSKELFWIALLLNRKLGSIPTPIKDSKSHYFTMNINQYAEFLHIIDKEMAGNFMGVKGLSENDKRQFVTRNIIEESIASSQLEGANTSRAVAKKMLVEGRKPENYDEQMIVNNHKAMLKIEQELYQQPLSLELIYELHAIITEKTIEANHQGKLRETFDSKGQPLKVKLKTGEIAYVAPPKAFVIQELPKLIAFANDQESSGGHFIHPLIKGIMLHFWIGLLHPFEDGNGRLARILFFWYMLKNDYWAFAYISLSEKIRKSPDSYAMAYIYSEQADNDLTYFIDYNIKQLKLAREAFQDYIHNKLKENKSIISRYQQDFNFNERQIKLLQYLNRSVDNRTTIAAHQKFYSVKKNTAISDLKSLCETGFLIKKKHGRNTYYYATEKIAKIFR